eukprot:m.119852 g.119852  ORF g.119852 m.119852 type:complete len:401 (-) comp16486_c2_seq1:142-1344(-)
MGCCGSKAGQDAEMGAMSEGAVEADGDGGVAASSVDVALDGEGPGTASRSKASKKIQKQQDTKKKPSRKQIQKDKLAAQKSAESILSNVPTEHLADRNELLPSHVMADKQEAETETVKLTKQEMQEVHEAHELVSGHFSAQELGHMYVGYKLNGKQIGRDEFNMVYSSFSKLANDAMTSAVFEMFDTNHDGSFSFLEFIKFFNVICHGRIEERAKLCFNLYDADNDGKLTKQELIDILATMPVEQLLKRRGSVDELKPTLSEITEEDEEEDQEDKEEDKEEAAKAKTQAGKIAAEAKSATSTPSPQSRRSSKEKRKSLYDEDALSSQRALLDMARGVSPEKKTQSEIEAEERAKRNAALAREVVEQLFVEIAHAEADVITESEFVASTNESETIHCIFPI